MLKKIIPFFMAVLFLFSYLTGKTETKAEEGFLTEEPETRVIRNKPVKLLNLENARLLTVLQIVTEKTGQKFVVREELGERRISGYLPDISLTEGLKAILEANGLYYKKIPATEIYLITDTKEVVTRVFHLNYIGADDIKAIIERQISSHGKVEVLSRTIPGGWELGGVSTEEKEMGKKRRAATEKEKKGQFLVVSDIPAVIEKISNLIAQLDLPLDQIFIDAMIVEVNSDAVKDLGIEWHSTGKGYQGSGGVDIDLAPGTIAAPSVGFTGLTIAYEHIIGDTLKVKLHALEQKKKANILSNPRIMTADNHEAVIIVGERYPIMTTTREESGSGTVYTTGSLDHYEPIGISLRVIPHVVKESYISMIIHPEVTSLGENVQAGSEEGALILPRINTREADTTVIAKDGEMVVIGGLVSEKMENNIYKIPLLGDIPILGHLFKRTEKKPTKIDLLIFITPHIISGKKIREFAEKEKLRIEKKQN